MMKYYISFICFILTFCYGCGKREAAQPEKGTLISIDMESALPSSRFLEKREMISLENKGDTFPGFVHKLLVENDTLYLLDTFKAHGLYVYDKSGHFLYSYNNVGQGREEFVRLSDFQIDNGCVYLLDTSGKKIIRLNKQCEYQSSKKLFCQPLAFVFDDKGGTWMDIGNNATEKEAYTLLCERDDEVMKYLPVPEVLRNRTIAPYFTLINVGEAIHFLPEMQNRIYQCSNNEVEVAYQLDFGKHWCSDSFLMENQQTDIMNLFRKMAEEKYVTDLNFLESDKLLVLYFNCDSNAYLFFYNKENKRQILTVDNEKAFFRPMAICNDNILFVEMNDSCNMVSKYRVLMD